MKRSKLLKRDNILSCSFRVLKVGYFEIISLITYNYPPKGKAIMNSGIYTETRSVEVYI